ncbi:MAG: DUF3040 domain-containing protein [Firmicutes bacterium]|nr:DUF3040 domain-containing protein [Bacillota bacterium]
MANLKKSKYSVVQAVCMISIFLAGVSLIVLGLVLHIILMISAGIAMLAGAVGIIVYVNITAKGTENGSVRHKDEQKRKEATKAFYNNLWSQHKFVVCKQVFISENCGNFVIDNIHKRWFLGIIPSDLKNMVYPRIYNYSDILDFGLYINDRRIIKGDNNTECGEEIVPAENTGSKGKAAKRSIKNLRENTSIHITLNALDNADLVIQCKDYGQGLLLHKIIEDIMNVCRVSAAAENPCC